MDTHKMIDAKTREYRKVKQARYRKKLRTQALELLGGCCVICGFSDIRALQIDHIEGGGSQERKKIKSGCAFLLNVINDKDNRYQLLCANCNWIKRAENNEGP